MKTSQQFVAALSTWIKKRLPAGSFTRALGTLLSGTILGQSLMLAVSPLLTRIYSPSDYGVMGVYLSVMSILAVGSMLRYEAAIPGAQEDEVVPLLTLTLVVAFIVATLIGIVLFVGRTELKSVHFLLILWPVRFLIAPGIFVASCYLTLSYWSVRVRDYVLLSRAKIAQNIVLAGTQISLGFAHGGPTGLVIGQIGGQTTGSVTIFFKCIKSWGSQSIADWTASVRRVAYRYRHFPKLSLPATIMEAVASALPVLFIASQFGSVVAGWLTLVQRVLLLPLSLLTTNITQIYFGEIASLKRDAPSSMRVVYISHLKKLSVLALISCGLIALFAPLLIPAIFGHSWKNSVICLEILLPFAMAGFIAGPFGCTLDVLERQGLHLLRDFIRLLMMLVTIGVCYMFHLDWKSSLVLISLAGVLGYGVYLWLSWVGIRDHKITQDDFDLVLISEIRKEEGL